ncbi:MAG: ATP synthase subunit I [Panacagrimonas sp.]
MSQSSIWGATLKKAVALQWGAVAALALIGCVLFGWDAGRSVLLGGVAVVLPNTLLALWLMPRMQPGGADAGGAVALMVAEGLKLMGTTALLLATVILLGPSLIWPGFLAGIVGTLLSQWLGLWVTRRY